MTGKEKVKKECRAIVIRSNFSPPITLMRVTRLSLSVVSCYIAAVCEEGLLQACVAPFYLLAL